MRQKRNKGGSEYWWLARKTKKLNIVGELTGYSCD
jgi:hypothetical protein